MTRAEIVAAVATAITAMWLAVPPVPSRADPGCSDSSDPTCGGHAWNGPLRKTYDTPGYYGGWNTGPEICSPFTYDCRGITPPG